MFERYVYANYRQSLMHSCAVARFMTLFNAQALGMTLLDAICKDVKFIADDLTDEEAAAIVSNA